MTVNVKGIDLDLMTPNRFYLIYENLFGESVDFNTKKYSTLMANLMHAVIVATIEKKGLNITFSKDDFKNWYDEQDPSIFKDFSDWFVLTLQAQAELSGNKNNEQEHGEKN